jgi:hypothetical protein
MDNVKYNLSLLKKTLPNNTNFDKVFVCIYKIVFNNNNLNLETPFLSYLLYKYQNDTNVIFPFKYLNNKNPNIVAQQLINDITDVKLKKKGYLTLDNNIYFFYHDVNDSILLQYLDKKNELWWTTIDEICNKQKLITYPIHDNVYNLFYNYNSLIYLLDNKNNKYEIPIIGYYGAPFQLIPYICTIGLKANSNKIFGASYYLGSFLHAIKYALWTSNYKQRNILGKNISDKDGKYYNSGIIRYVVFLKNNTQLLYHPDNLFNNLILNLDTNKINKNIKNIKKGDWKNKFNSITISNIKFKNLSGFFNIHTQYIINNFEQLYPISCHEINTHDTLNIYNPNFKKYTIK